MENIFFNCNNTFLELLNNLADNDSEQNILNTLHKNEYFPVKNKLAISSDMDILELKTYIHFLENKGFISINQIEYLKTKTDLKGFKLMLNLTYEEITSLFSTKSALALFLIKTLKFMSEKQTSECLHHEFEIIKVDGDHISFFCFALNYETIKKKTLASLFHTSSQQCEFEKFSSIISTTRQHCNKFEEKFTNITNPNQKATRERFIKSLAT